MNAITQPEVNVLTVSKESAYGLLMDSNAMDRMERIADLMASGRTTVPQHIRGSKGDCFAIVLQSMQWGMNPIAVAQKTHIVNGTLGYEAQLVAAVINTSGVVRGRFNFEWFGPWEKIVGKFKTVESRTKKDDNGNPKKYVVPNWRPEDEEGLGVRVWATIKGESTPRELTLLMAQARTRNSTLWTDDPKQQLAYLAQKRWARLFTPDVILGVYTADELAEPGEKFMGPADVVTPPAPVTHYDQAKFDGNFAKWAETIATGRKTAADYIQFAESRKEPFTEAQKARLLSVKKAPASQTDVQDVQPKDPPATAPNEGAPAVTYADLAGKLRGAQTLDALDDAASLIAAVASDQHQQELEAIYDERAQALGGE